MATTTRHHDAAAEARPTSVRAALLRGAVGGMAAGAVFAAVTMWFTASLGDPAKMPLLMIAAMVQGQDALTSGTANPILGAVVHMLLSAVFGMAFALLATRLHSNSAVAVAGVLYGTVLYLVNFLIVAPLLFPWFTKANQPFELAIHVVFGALVSFAALRRSSTRPATT